MVFDSIYKNRPYLFEIKEDSFGGNEQIIHEVLKHTDLNLSNVSISFVNSNYNYDIYKIKSDQGNYCIKYSLDSGNRSLKKEFDILKSLPNAISPKAVAYGKMQFGDAIHYLITSFENTEDLKSLGVSCITENIDAFLIDLQNLQNSEIETNSFNDYLTSFLKTVSVESLPEESIEAIESHSDLRIIKETITAIENELLHLCSPKIVKDKRVCHGNLKSSNILFKNGSFKFIDLNDSFHGNPYLDLASLIIYSGLSKEMEKHIVESFIKIQNKSDMAEQMISYQSCYQIMIRKIFLELLTTYLKEVYVFSSSRPMKIVDCVDLFSKNAASFFRISAVEKHKEFIYRCMLEPIVGFNN
jgi:aminoglycoside phosphotransferase